MNQKFIDFLEDDLEAILGSRGFDEPMEFLADERGPVAFRGLFSGPTVENNPGGSSAPVAGQDYSVAFKETDLPRRPKYGDRLRARGRIWKVYKPQADGQGLLTVSLHLSEEE